MRLERELNCDYIERRGKREDKDSSLEKEHRVEYVASNLETELWTMESY